MGYHKALIPRGILGEVSKIEEEIAELRDALEQNNKIMAIHELSDVYTAMEILLKERFPSITMEDLHTMSRATRSAFADGTRKAPPIPNITVDHLRQHVSMIHFFGLGFIQIKLGEYDRVHVYHPDLVDFVDDPHDHRYDFVSHVLVGNLVNTMYEFTECDTHATDLRTEETSCEPNGNIDTTSTPVRLVSKRMFTTQAGNSYHTGMDQFHTVKAHGKCVTYLRRAKVSKDYARIVRRVGEQKKCPFSNTIAEPQLWECVEDALR